MHRARLANVMARLSESGVENRTDLLYDLRLYGARETHRCTDNTKT